MATFNQHKPLEDEPQRLAAAPYGRLVRQQRLPTAAVQPATLRSFHGHLLKPKEKAPSNNNNNTALGSECLYS